MAHKPTFTLVRQSTISYFPIENYEASMYCLDGQFQDTVRKVEKLKLGETNIICIILQDKPQRLFGLCLETGSMNHVVPSNKLLCIFDQEMASNTFETEYHASDHWGS